MQYSDDLTAGMTYYGQPFSGYTLNSLFDDTPSTICYTKGSGGNPAVDRIVVDFGIGKKIQQVTLLASTYSCNDFKIQYSDDNITFYDIYTGKYPGADKQIIQFTNNIAHRYWAVFVLSTNMGGSSGFYEIEMMSGVSRKYLIKHDSSYYSIKEAHYSSEIKAFSPLPLNGVFGPDTLDIENYGFDDIGHLLAVTTISSETFKPVDKMYNNFEIKEYRGK